MPSHQENSKAIHSDLLVLSGTDATKEVAYLLSQYIPTLSHLRTRIQLSEELYCATKSPENCKNGTSLSGI